MSIVCLAPGTHDKQLRWFYLRTLARRPRRDTGFLAVSASPVNSLGISIVNLCDNCLAMSIHCISFSHPGQRPINGRTWVSTGTRAPPVCSGGEALLKASWAKNSDDRQVMWNMCVQLSFWQTTVVSWDCCSAWVQIIQCRGSLVFGGDRSKCVFCWILSGYPGVRGLQDLYGGQGTIPNAVVPISLKSVITGILALNGVSTVASSTSCQFSHIPGMRKWSASGHLENAGTRRRTFSTINLFRIVPGRFWFRL